MACWASLADSGPAGPWLPAAARAVIRSHRGVEAGTVLCSATPRHARYLPNTTVGQFLRPDFARGRAEARLLRQRGQEVLQRAALLAGQLRLPLEWLDGEMLLDGEHVVLHHLRGGECDVRPLVSTLSREFALHVLLQDLARPVEPAPAEDEEHGCGRENCGSGNCGRLRHRGRLRQLRRPFRRRAELFRGAAGEDGTARAAPVGRAEDGKMICAQERRTHMG